MAFSESVADRINRTITVRGPTRSQRKTNEEATRKEHPQNQRNLNPSTGRYPMTGHRLDETKEPRDKNLVAFLISGYPKRVSTQGSLKGIYFLSS